MRSLTICVLGISVAWACGSSGWAQTSPQNTPESSTPGGFPKATAAEEPSSPPTAEQINEWIKSLESDAYTARIHATEQLILAGPSAVQPVLAAIDKAGLETITRGIYILRQMALDGADVATQQSAYDALQEVSKRRFSGASRRAAQSIEVVHVYRYQQAQKKLVQLGAILGDTMIQAAEGVPQEYPSITLGPAWNGTADDLQLIGWLTAYNERDRMQGIMVILEGKQWDDESLALIVKQPNLSVLRLKSCPVSDAGLRVLQDVPRLEVLEIFYCALTDESLASLARLTKVTRLRLIGTRVSVAGRDQLQQQMAQAEIDYRSGGFLGVACHDNPCQIYKVVENSAAATAGLEPGDVIVRYNEQPVTTMSELTQLISQHDIGHEVSIEVMRQGQRVKRKVQLGQWD